jgi:PAS domain S-box-containing protein
LETVSTLSEEQLQKIALNSPVSYAHVQDNELDTKHLLELLGDSVWDWNLLTNEMVFSSGFQTLLGYTADGFSHRIDEWFKRMHPDDAKISLEKIRACVEGERAHFIDTHRLLCPDGTWKKVRVRGAIAARTLKGRAARLQGFISADEEVSNKFNKAEDQESLMADLALQLPNIVFFQMQRFLGGRCCFPFVSDGIENLHGVKAEEIIDNAAPLFDRVHSDDIGSVRLDMKNSAQSLLVWNLAYRVRLEQCERYVSGSAIPTKQDDGSVIWNGYITDATENYYHQIQSESLKWHLQYDVKFDDVGRFDIQVQTGKAQFSQDFSALLGISYEYLNRHEEFWPFFWKECVHPDDIEECKNVYLRHFKSHGETPCHMQFRLRSANGEWRWLRAAGSVVEWDAQGKAVRMLGTHIDVTVKYHQELERRHLEDLLRSGRDRYKHLAGELELLLTHTPVGVMLVHNGKILRANTTLAQLFGYPNSKMMLGISIPDLHQSHDSYKKVHDDIYARLKQEKFADAHCVLKKADDSLFGARLIGRLLPVEQFAGATVWVIEEWNKTPS